MDDLAEIREKETELDALKRTHSRHGAFERSGP
jgi:hypothetical protein